MLNLEEFHSQFWEDLLASFKSDEETAEFLESPKYAELFEETAEERASSLADNLLNNSSEQLSGEATERAGFENRNYERWKEGFDAIVALISSCSEIGQAVSHHFQSNADDVSEMKASALITLHARCVRIANEIFALMRTGFPDGAYARWRTLHELYVTAAFIAKSSDETATRYHHAWLLRCYKAAKEYEKYKSDLDLQDFGKEELETLKLRTEEIKKLYKDDLSGDWSWARTEFPIGENERRVNFTDLQNAIGFDHWRPYVTLAHQEVHAGFVRPDKGLGVSESQDVVHLVGASNSGMLDPGQNMAFTLTNITIELLAVKPTLDTIAFSKALLILREKTVEKLLIGHQRTREG